MSNDSSGNHEAQLHISLELSQCVVAVMATRNSGESLSGSQGLEETYNAALWTLPLDPDIQLRNR
jgi:hypothetical protein